MWSLIHGIERFSNAFTNPWADYSFAVACDPLHIRYICRGGSRILEWGVKILKKSENQILFQYLRDKKKKRKEKSGLRKKGGGAGVKIHPFHHPWIRA